MAVESRTRGAAAGPLARRPGTHTAAVRVAALAGAVAVVVLAWVASLAVGSRAIPPGDVLRVLLEPDGSQASAIVRDLRVPRTGVALAVGAALGLAGAQLRGLTRNPLADPGLLGVSAGAALGGVTVSAFVGTGGAPGRAAAALAGAVAATAAVWVLAGPARAGGGGPVALLLAGVALTALLTSLTTVLVLLDAETLDEYRFWVVGSVAGRDLGLLAGVLPLLLTGAVLAAWSAPALDLLALGDDLARGLGARVEWQRAGILVSASLLTAAAVAVAGPLTFVGLLVPHLARPLVGASHRWLLPMSALLGAALVAVSDVVGRVVLRPAELQAGVVTAFVGAPVLLALARRARVGDARGAAR